MLNLVGSVTARKLFFDVVSTYLCMVLLHKGLLRGHNLRAYQILVGLEGLLVLVEVVNDVIFVSQLGQPYVASRDRYIRLLV